MTASRTVSSWIRSEHLEPNALERYHQAFTSHPARLAVVKNFLHDDVAAKLSRFLATEAQFKLEYGLYSVEDRSVSEEEWLKADEDERFFRFSKLTGAPTGLSPNVLAYLRFRKTFQDASFREFFEAICGMPLGWSDDFGSHSMKQGDFLRPHSDEGRNRRLALVIYLSPDWEPRFGGELKMVDPSGNVTPVEPEYNSVVLFDVAAGTTHYVDPIPPAAGDRARLSIGGWYHKAS